MNVYQEMVEEFHQATDSTIGQFPELQDNLLRAKLIIEEAVETAAAMGFLVKATIVESDGTFTDFKKNYQTPNFPDAIDGLCDLIYVVLGSAVAWGIDLDPFFIEVHRTNMDKLKGPKREDGKQLKPDGWKPPDIEKHLFYQQNLAEAWADMAAEFWAEGEVVNINTEFEERTHSDGSRFSASPATHDIYEANTAEARHEKLLNGEAA